MLDSTSVEETLRRVTTEDTRGRFAKLRLSIPKAFTPLRRSKTDPQRDISPASDNASTRAIYDGASSFSPRLKQVSRHLCELAPWVEQMTKLETSISLEQSRDGIRESSESGSSPADQDTSPGSYTNQSTPSLFRLGILPDLLDEKEIVQGDVTFRDDGTKAKIWADYCAEHTQLKSYDATIAVAAAAELLEHRTGASILTAGPMEAVDRFPLTARERSDPFQTGMESPSIDKVFQLSSTTCKPSTIETDKGTRSANEKAPSTRLKTKQAPTWEKPGKAKKSRQNSSVRDNTAQQVQYNNWRDLEWEDKCRERGVLASELSQWSFDKASNRRHKTLSTHYGPKWEVSTPANLSGLVQQDDYFTQRNPTGCKLRTSVTPNLTRQEDITEYIKHKFEAHAEQMEARANAVPYSHPCTGRPSRDFSSGEILERENNSSASEFNRSRDLRDSITDRKLSGSPRDSKFCRTTIHADVSPPLSRGESIGLPDCSNDPMVRAAGFEKKVSSRNSSGATSSSKLSGHVHSIGVEDCKENPVGRKVAGEQMGSRVSQQQSAQPGLVKVRQGNGETLQLGGKG